ncbi:hypothetical protein HYH02_008700 [Chlamydomonas schloesseri]|uniref:BACK domain-containing protein n=1 Tax=Chlamydomonas schloesseri TaxID=2026947 RepID=A0A835WD66_9CHLO|nr:hypothetical protein HYH02_008700 [Chlamydomonas schloesseri]|eukprot:KAG2445232.1 hypothetical protein HYH02_008700 [Chlamydomonas schloesseri]
MSDAVRKKLAKRFGSEERSDCQVLFFLEPEPEPERTGAASSVSSSTEHAHEHALATDAQGRVLVGAPLPAHSHVLSDGSERFCAELERWKVGAVAAAATGAAGSTAGAGAAAASDDRSAAASSSSPSGCAAADAHAPHPAKRQRVDGDGAAAAAVPATATATAAAPPPPPPPCPGGRMQLFVGLHHPDELRLAEALLRFMYTGEVSLRSAADLLRARPIALRLAVEGGVEACDSALRALFSTTHGSDASTAKSLVEELYTCRALLPEPASSAGADPTGPQLRAVLMASCRSAMVRSCKGMALPAAATAAPAAAGSGAGAGAAVAPAPAAAGAAPAAVPVGELLAFAFEDALAVLNNATALFKLRQLPAAALEALLASEGFGTDDEASVVVLLAEWRAANTEAAAQGDTLKRLLRQVRWPHVCDEYLLHVVPRVGWLGVSWERAAWLSSYARATLSSTRAALEVAALTYGASYELDAPGHIARRRPAARPLGARPFSMEVASAIASQASLDGAPFKWTDLKVCARGFMWTVAVAAAVDGCGVRLACGAPRVLASTFVGHAYPGKDVTLQVLNAAGGVACEEKSGTCHRCVGIGLSRVLKVKTGSQEERESLLRDGRLHGEVVWWE